MFDETINNLWEVPFMQKTLCAVAFSMLVLSPAIMNAQAEIVSIPFGTVPEGTNFVAGAGAPIGLQSDTEVTGTLSATGTVSSDSGFQFPDGSIQVTAGAAGAGLTANSGLYSNTIAGITPPNAYTEICFKSSTVLFDIHAASEPASGGNCEPGDIGWIIERFERDSGMAVAWTSARADCLLDGMRLPEPFEWQFSCNGAALFALDSMIGNYEWASNSTYLDTVPNNVAVATPIFGLSSCSGASRGIVGNTVSSLGQQRLRCVR